MSQGNSREHTAMCNTLVYKKNKSKFVATDCFASSSSSGKIKDGN